MDITETPKRSIKSIYSIRSIFHCDKKLYRDRRNQKYQSVDRDQRNQKDRSFWSLYFKDRRDKKSNGSIIFINRSNMPSPSQDILQVNLMKENRVIKLVKLIAKKTSENYMI